MVTVVVCRFAHLVYTVVRALDMLPLYIADLTKAAIAAAAATATP